MAYTTQTLEEMIAFARDEIRNRIPGADVSSGSYYDLRARLLAVMFMGGQAQGQYLARQILPDTAESEFLLRHAGVRRLSARAATAAVGRGLLVSSIPGVWVQAAASVLTHADGTAYVLSAPCTVQLAAWTGKTVVGGSTRSRVLVSPNTTSMATGDVLTINGQVVAIREVLGTVSAIDVYPELNAAPTAATAITATLGGVAQITASTKGKKTNKPQRDSLVLAAPATNVSATCQVVEFSGGADDETTEELRSRVLDFIAIPPGSGNVEDWRSWARATPSVRVAEAFVFPNQRGLGTVDVYPIGVSGARFPSAGMIAAVKARLVAEGPAFVDAEVKSISYTGGIDVSVTLIGAPDQQTDWGLSSLTIGGSSTVTRVFVTANPVGLIEIGDRIVVPIQIGAQWDSYQRTVTSVTTTYVDVAEPFPYAPVAGNDVTSGGPLWQSAYDAIVSIFDLLGPGVVNAGIGYQRHPSEAYTFGSVLYISEIVAAMIGLTGAINAVVTAPASDALAALGQVIRRGKITIIG